jgi:hypothetical protein
MGNESFHVVKGKYADRFLKATISTETPFALGVIPQSRNPDGHDELSKFSDIPPFPAERSRMLRDLESKCQRKNGEWKQEPERRKKNEKREPK